MNSSDGTLPSASGSIGAVAVAPSNPLIIYAGTGESDIRGDIITGDGVYKSTDGGKSWRPAGLRDTHTTSALLVDPKNPNIVYASSMGHVFAPNAERGVYKSVDGGRTWRKVLFVNADTGAIDLVMDPNHASVLYAATWQAYRRPWILSSGGPGSGLYKSTDGGEHWTNLSRNAGFPAAPLGKIGVAIAASNPSIVYAIVQAKEGGVFRSADGGATWQRVNSEMKLRQRAFYYMAIFVDPKNPDLVYVPEVDALWVSHDGGKTFAKLHTPHGDNHALWIDPTNTRVLLEGNDGGATVSTDGGATWSDEHNQPTGQFYHVSLDGQFPYHIYGAQQDEDSFDGPSASSKGYISVGDWRSVAYGESTFIAPQPDDPNITYGSGYYSILLRYDSRTGQYQSISPWPHFQAGAASAELKYRFGWTHPILFSATNPKQLLVGAQYVLSSEDYGQTWATISPDLTRNDPASEGPTGGPVDLDQTSAEVFPGVSAIATSPVDGKVMWAGSDDGFVWVTTDAAKTWQKVTPPTLPQWAQISCIEASHDAAGTAYVSASRYMWDDFHPYIFTTTDYGRHWTSLTGGLPDDQYVFAVRQDPNQAALLFAGTKNTVYVSFDGGLHWQPLSLNLPRAQIRDIAINTRQGEVVVATHGRAFWVLGDLAFLEQLATTSGQSAAARVFSPQTAFLTHAYGATEFSARVPSAGKNPQFGATVYFDIPSSYDGKTPAILRFLDAQGRMVRSFSLHLKKGTEPTEAERDQMTPAQLKQAAQEKLTAIQPGINRFQWNLRYPDATEVNGFWTPIAAGGLPDDVDGPVVTPGRYTVVLGYGDASSTSSFDVRLDPSLTATPDDLAARLALQLQIHTTLDTLDQTINAALDARTKLNVAMETGRLTTPKARTSLTTLDDEIGELVQLNIHSSEGQLLHEAKLRSHLAYLSADIDLAFVRPTTAQYAVFDELDKQAKSGEQQLEADTRAALHLIETGTNGS
ncbi:MAG: glycosyl hydrolase [Candidatus Eremiobacteraeota bacterium]|nr:glycosyl hydrolase [Candidatus Eremiobacteraeota bacterium]